MNKIIYTSILLILLSVCLVKADNLRSVPTSNNFVISRNISLSAKKISAEQNFAIRNLITRNNGNIVDKSIIKKVVLPTIAVKQSNKIPGIYSKKAFEIDITKKSIKIRITSTELMQKAIETLSSLVVVNAEGEKCFQGGKYIWSDDSPDNDHTNNSHKATEIKQLMATLSQTPVGTTIELVVVTPDEWMIEAPVITKNTGNDKLYNNTSGYVSIEQMKELIEKASARQITINISLQLQEENKPFLDCTGHSVFSVEGMRFLRASLSQWHDECGATSFKIYTNDNPDDAVNTRFNQFLKEISPLIGINIE